jgi:hypothetical protein
VAGTVIETRVDIRDLATIHKYFIKKGLTITNRSELVRTVIEVYKDLIVSSLSGNIKRFESQADAFNHLAQFGITFKRNSKGHRNIIKMLQEEAVESFNNQSLSKKEIPILADVDEEKYNEALNILMKEDMNEE